VKDDHADLLADSHNILQKCKSYFPQLLNVYNVSNVRQIEINTAEQLIPGSSYFEVQTALALFVEIQIFR
jgi:hypothetical protein